MKPLTTSALLAWGGLAALRCGVFSAAPQTLPGLTAAFSNRTVNISWPYTNAGFALEESAALRLPSNWRTSALTAVFDSHRATFSVSALATNATRLRNAPDSRRFDRSDAH